jgi:hypothetical protein
MRKTRAFAWKCGAEHSCQLAMGREYLSTHSPRSNNGELFAYGQVQDGTDERINQHVREKERGTLSFTYLQHPYSDHASLFIFSPHLAKISGDGEERVSPDTCLPLCEQQEQTPKESLYRLMATNIYKTRDERCFHIHGLFWLASSRYP